MNSNRYLGGSDLDSLRTDDSDNDSVDLTTKFYQEIEAKEEAERMQAEEEKNRDLAKEAKLEEIETLTTELKALLDNPTPLSEIERTTDDRMMDYKIPEKPKAEWERALQEEEEILVKIKDLKEKITDYQEITKSPTVKEIKIISSGEAVCKRANKIEEEIKKSKGIIKNFVEYQINKKRQLESYGMNGPELRHQRRRQNTLESEPFKHQTNIFFKELSAEKKERPKRKRNDDDDDSKARITKNAAIYVSSDDDDDDSKARITKNAALEPINVSSGDESP